ncbi:MAG: hypothetical protein CMJ05_09365 [Pelagibacterales bacterium]|nr:hypothetical protein [Pelagibacterales bacterium]
MRSYKAMLEQQMIEIDYKSFDDFLVIIETGFGDKDLQIVYELHAKYFNHNFNIPCGCGGAKKIDTINKWISDLKKVHANGVQTK